ncbi:hypothetical protein EDB86DRAFT_3103652, partial [Lactarius hatsudake]
LWLLIWFVCSCTCCENISSSFSFHLSLRSKASLHRKDRWFTLSWESVFPCQCIFLVQLTRKDKCIYCRNVLELC